MTTLEDTTTSIRLDDMDEDKTLILNGAQRRRYFNSILPPGQPPAQPRRSLLHRVLSRLHLA